MGQDQSVSNLQFSYVAETGSFDKASKKIEAQLTDQEKLVGKTEKSFLSLNKVLLASGVGISLLAVKKMPELRASLLSAGKGGLGLVTSLEKIFVATQGVFGPFAKVATAVSSMTAGFQVASLSMSALGVSSAGAISALSNLATLAGGGVLLALAGLISVTQSLADSLANSLIAKLEDSIEVGARLETQTFALGLSLENYRKATGDTSVTIEAMTGLLDDLGRTTGLTRGELKGGLTQMLNLSRATGLTSDQIKILIERAADMSVALGVDFNEAVVAIDQSFKGYNQQLLNFGVNITESTLGATEFVKSQDRTVDSLSDSQLAMAKFETILDQTSTSVGALSKANLTIKGSALNAELAMESFANRLGEASQKIFGPAIVKINNLRASMFDLAGQGGAAKLSASVTAVGAVVLKSIALILKWGTALVFIKEGLKLLRFALGNTGKAVGLFTGLLNFMGTTTRAASAGLGLLTKTTGKYAFASKFAAKAQVGLNVASGGFFRAARLTGKGAAAAAKKFTALGGASRGVWVVLRGLVKVLVPFLLQLGWWSLIGVVIGASFFALIGIVKGLTKGLLSLFGTNPSEVFEFMSKKVDGLAASLKDLALFLVGFPERIALSMEFVVNSIALGVVSALSKIDLFTSKLSGSLAKLRAENVRIGSDILALDREAGKKADPEKAPREFPDSRALIRARKAADLARLDLINAQEATFQRISFIQEKIQDNEADILAIVRPELALKEKIVKLEAERARIQGGRAANAELEKKGFPAEAEAAKVKILKIDEEILAINEAIEAVGAPSPRELEEVSALKEQRLDLDKQERDELKKKRDLVLEVTQAEGFGLQSLVLSNEALRLQNVNRLEGVVVERQLLDLQTKNVQEAFKLAKAEAGGSLGDNEQLFFNEKLIAIEQSRLSLLIREKALRREILDELGPLNEQFQEARRAELAQRVNELRDAGASAIEITRILGRAARDNQRAVWQETIAQSNDSVEILKAKMSIFFEDTRTAAQKTAEVMFNVFQSFDAALSSSLTNIATGVTDLKDGFKDFRRNVLDSVISTFVELGLQQAKTFLIQKSGFLQAVNGLESEGTRVAVLTSQYVALAKAKSQAGSAGSSGAAGSFQAGGTFFSATGLQQAPIDRSAAKGAAGSFQADDSFVSGTGSGGTSRLSTSFRAAGFGALGGGAVGGSVGGAEGGQAGAIGGAIGAAIGAYFGPAQSIVGGAVGGLMGGLFGRSKKKRRKRREAERKEAVKFLKDLSDDLDTGAVTLGEALVRVGERIKVSSGPAREELERFEKELRKTAKLLKKSLIEVADALKQEIGILQLDFDIRDTAAAIQNLSDKVGDLRKEFAALPDAVPGFEKLLSQFTDDSLAEMLRQADKTIGDISKAFNEGARADSGELISITARSIRDIAKLNESLVKLEKDRAKAVKDIQNEGVAQRQKTIKKDKEERIAKVNETFGKEKTSRENQISTIQTVTQEQVAQRDKDLALAEKNKTLITDAQASATAKKGQDAAALESANATLTRLKGELGPAEETLRKAELLLTDFSSTLDGRPIHYGDGSNRRIAKARAIIAAARAEKTRIVEGIADAEGRVAQFTSTAPVTGPTVNAFAKGGPVEETGPALVHEGEFVVKKSVAQPLMPILEALNNNRIPAVRSSSAGSGRQSALPDMSITVSIGSVDSPGRVREIEQVVSRLQRRQLNNVRQMIQV